MKLKKILQIRSVLTKHANEPIPTVLAYKILKFMKASDTEGAFYDKRLKEIIEAYGKKDDEGKITYTDGCVSIVPEHMEDFQKAIDELGETDVEAPAITFTIQELTPISFSVTELYSLDDLIIEGEQHAI